MNLAKDPEGFLQVTRGKEQKQNPTMGEVTQASPLKVKLDGYSAALTKTFARLASYSPVVGDRVYVSIVGHSHVVLGKVVKD